ncbi:transposase [Streptomyces scopuliridis]|uniref:transposase n=1 Tax=Streptomyces scopuliridis TaxID=452529 RepID=UPI0036BA5626
MRSASACSPASEATHPAICANSPIARSSSRPTSSVCSPSRSWRDYRDLLIAAHAQLGGPIILIRDNLNVHKAAGLREFAETRDWLTIYHLPPYAPDLNPVEGIWSLLRRSWLSNVAFTTPEHLVQRIRRGLRRIQYRSHLIDGYLTETGLTIRPA